MTCAPNKRYSLDTPPNFDNVKTNNELHIPALKINTDQSLLSTHQPIKMKKPERMRTDNFKGNTKSSAIESHLIVSDYGEPSNRQGRGVKRNLFVSSRYIRRASSHSVTFALPESEKINGKDNNENGSQDKINSNEETSEKDYDSLALRRMSAPELPPISPNGKTSNGFLTTRSNTFHNYRFNAESRKNRRSIHSDSSILGYGINSQSRTSSSSSQKSRARVLSAGTERRQHNPLVSEGGHLVDIPPSVNKKTDKKANLGMPTMVHPSRSPSGNMIRRNNSKHSLVNQSQKTNNTPRGTSLKHSNSEGHLNRGLTEIMPTPRQQQIIDTKKPIKRVSSDKSLTDQKNSKNTTGNGNGFTRNGQKGAQTMKSVNGIKKSLPSSRLSLKADEKKSDSGSLERLNYDSDSDGDRDRRVQDWILGVTDANAEPPEEPQIEYQDEPPQRDTAIRIVYDGDS